MNTLRTDLDHLGADATGLHRHLDDLVSRVPGIMSAAVVSSDGFLLASSQAAAGAGSPPAPGAPAGARSFGIRPTGPSGARADLAAVVSGLAGLTGGAAQLMDMGPAKQTVVTMDNGHLFVMAISDGSLLGVHAALECDLRTVAFEMAMFVGRAGWLLDRESWLELRSGPVR